MEKQENSNKRTIAALEVFDKTFLEYKRYISPRHLTAEIDKVDVCVREIMRKVIKDDNKGFLLMGPVGSGKTSILAIMLREVLKRNPDADVLYCTHDKIVGYLRRHKAEMTENDAEIPSYMKSDYIFIDDFGRTYSDKAGWNLSLQDEYFDYLWRNNVRVYATTNLTPAQFQKEIKSNGELARIYDRLFDKSWVTRIVMTNNSKRG